MKIKMLSPRPWSMTKGGIEVQIEKTTEYLNLIGIDAKYFDFYDQSLDYEAVHLFGADYVFNDIAKLIKGSGKKLFVSSIYYTEYPHLLRTWMSTIDRLTWRSYFGMKKNVLNHADIVLPNSRSELIQMNYIFDVPMSKMTVVPNGVDPCFEFVDGNLFYQTYGWKDFVLCVSRLDSRKNIHKLIEAVLKTDLRLVLVGMLDHNKSSYGASLLSLINSNPEQIKYIGPLEHDSELFKSAYGACSIHALPSRLETPGLCNLEAGLAGKKIVVSDLPTIREYLDDFPFYCSPGNVDSIKNALLRAHSSANSSDLKSHIRNNFLWNVVAEKTKGIYLNNIS